MQKWDGWWSPTLSKVQEEWDSVNTTRGKVGCECTNHKLLPCELPSCVHQPSRKWKMAFAGAKSPQDVRVCFCRSHGAAGMLQVHMMAHLTPALNLTARERAWKQTGVSWGLKNSFQPPKLNWPWINPTSQAVQWLQSSLCRPRVSNLIQVACQTACTHPTAAGTSGVPEDATSPRKTGLCFSVSACSI